jgi:hypothetical protein
LFTGLVVVVFALTLLFVAAKQAWQSAARRGGATRVTGQVSRHVEVPSDGAGGATFRLEVRFRYRGQDHVCATESSTAFPRRLGRSVSVLIPPAGPRHARVQTLGEAWGLTLLWGWLGVAFLAGGVVLILAGP